MQSEYDIVIAGGGFAGLKAAEAGAKGGAEVIVCERSTEIGYPIHTSGGSFIPDLENAGISEELYHPIETVEFISPSESAAFEYESPKFCVIDVRNVRQHLAERAIDAGSTVVTDTPVSGGLVTEGGKVTGVTVQSDGTSTAINGEVTIDATGFRAVVAQDAGIHDGFDRFGRGIEYDVYAPEYDSTTAKLIVGNSLIPGGYGWIFPYAQDRVRVGVGSLFPDAENDLRESIDELFERYGDCGISKSAQIESHSGVIPSKGAPGQTVADGLIVTGDAANFPFGTVGEGIRMALETGQVAGETAARRTVGELTDMAPYEEYWKSKYETSLEISYVINEKISALDDTEWDKGTRMLRTISPADFYHLLRCDFTLREIVSLGMSNPQIPYLIGKEFARSKLTERFSH